jgi:purine-binding chemotaxis protein CheW
LNWQARSTVSTAEIQPPPVIVKGDAAQNCITGVINHGERLLIMLDLNRLFSNEEKTVLESLE